MEITAFMCMQASKWFGRHKRSIIPILEVGYDLYLEGNCQERYLLSEQVIDFKVFLACVKPLIQDYAEDVSELELFQEAKTIERKKGVILNSIYSLEIRNAFEYFNTHYGNLWNCINKKELIKNGVEHYKRQEYLLAHFFFRITETYKDSQGYLASLYTHGRGVKQKVKVGSRYALESSYQKSRVGLNVLGKLHYKGVIVEYDFEKALSYFRESAIQNYPGAFTNIGLCYKRGTGIEKDYKKAKEWFEKGAGEGDSKALYHLAHLHQQGLGVKKDSSLYFSHLQRSAELGYNKAILELATYYLQQTPPSQHVEAVPWLQKAAEKGVIEAMLTLSYMHCDGIGTHKDYTSSYRWAKRAMEHGSVAAITLLGFLYMHGKGVDQNNVQGLLWLQHAASLDDVDAIYCIAINYTEGIGVEQSEEKAFSFYLRAAKILENKVSSKLVDTPLVKSFQEKKKERDIAIFKIVGNAYIQGTIVEKCLDTAIHWYEAAAKKNDIPVILKLSQLYLEDCAIRNVRKSLFWLQYAANLNSLDALYKIGSMYIEGKYLRIDYKKAVRYLEHAAQNGHAESSLLLGDIYSSELLGEADLSQSLHYYILSAQQGDLEAMEKVIRIYTKKNTKYHNHLEGISWCKHAAQKGSSKAKEYLSRLDNHLDIHFSFD